MKREMRFHAVPHRSPVLRRRLHHDFADMVVLKPGRKMLDLASGGSEGPLLITGFAVVIPPDHYRQHLLVNVDSRQNTAGDCCRFHRCFHLRVPVPFWPKRHGTGPKLSVTITRSARPRGSDARHPHLFLRIGPRSNTLAASPTPVPSTISSAASTRIPFSSLFLPACGHLTPLKNVGAGPRRRERRSKPSKTLPPLVPMDRRQRLSHMVFMFSWWAAGPWGQIGNLPHQAPRRATRRL